MGKQEKKDEGSDKVPDMEKTINDLEEIEENMTFYKHPESAKVVRDAIELLKELKEHEELLKTLGYYWTGKGETLALCSKGRLSLIGIGGGCS